MDEHEFYDAVRLILDARGDEGRWALLIILKEDYHRHKLTDVPAACRGMFLADLRATKAEWHNGAPRKVN